MPVSDTGDRFQHPVSRAFRLRSLRSTRTDAERTRNTGNFAARCNRFQASATRPQLACSMCDRIAHFR
jgi:hypothetical protein